MKQRSRTEYSIMNMGTNIVGYGINTLMGFICRIVFVRVLSAEYLGVNGLFTNILSMLSLAELGINSAITFALYKPLAEGDERKITAIMRFYRKTYAVIGVVVGAVGLSLLPFLDVLIGNALEIKENIYLLYLLYLTNSVTSYFFSYRQALLIASQRQYIITGYNFIVTITQSLLQILFLTLTREYIFYLLIQIVGGIAYNVWVSLKAKKDYSYIMNKDIEPLSKEEKKTLFKNVKALAINKLSGVLVNSTDNIVVTAFDGIKTVGYLSNYTLFSSILDKLVTNLFNGLVGSVGNLNAQVDDEEKYRFFKIINLSNFWVYGYAAIGIAFVSGDLVKLFYGAEYVLPIELPIILAVNFYTIGTLHAVYTYKSTLGLFRYGQYILLFTGVINIALDIVLGKLMGTFGIFLATLCARACTNLWYEPYAVFKYGLKKKPSLYFKRYFMYAVLLVTAAVTCYFLCAMCVFSVGINIVLKLIICSVIPNGLFWLVFRKTDEGRYLLGSFKRIFTRFLKSHN